MQLAMTLANTQH